MLENVTFFCVQKRQFVYFRVLRVKNTHIFLTCIQTIIYDNWNTIWVPASQIHDGFGDRFCWNIIIHVFPLFCTHLAPFGSSHVWLPWVLNLVCCLFYASTLRFLNVHYFAILITPYAFKTFLVVPKMNGCFITHWLPGCFTAYLS